MGGGCTRGGIRPLNNSRTIMAIYSSLNTPGFICNTSDQSLSAVSRNKTHTRSEQEPPEQYLASDDVSWAVSTVEKTEARTP